MPLKEDYSILRILKSTKAAYDKLRGRKHLTVEEKMPLVEEMTSSTLDLAAKDWKKFINQDQSLSASWRREKIQYLEDFIGISATRTARLKDLGFVKQMALWERREKDGEGVSSYSSPPPSSSSSSNSNRDETNSSRGRPRKVQRMDDEEGEGGEETEGGEDSESNDNDVDYQPPSRKKSRGGGDDGDDGGIACSVPRDLLRRLTPLAEKMGWSMRDQLLAAVGVYEILGLDSSEMDLSLSSAWRLRVNHAQETSESSLNSMAEEVKRKNGKVFVHFDEVEVEQDLSGVRKKQARLAVLVSSPVLDKADQLISAVPLDSKSGADVAEAVYLTLAEQELEERVMGIICDTTASNFGRFSGAVTCLQVRNRISCV